jgi:S-adenosylmethionine decarboxylase
MASNIPIGGFEGAEKRLEIDFKFNPNCLNGLRNINEEEWQEVLNYVKCTIISSTQNEYFDSYVLSESSLFVYPFKMMLKTCGTTTLLRCIPKLLEVVQNKCDLAVEFVMFSRKNYLFPTKQCQLHRTWDSEVKCLNEIFDGNSYIIGPLSSDHWYLYLADYSDNSRVICPEKTLEMMMHKLDASCAAQFYRKEDTADKDKFPGISDLIQGSETDEFNFTPCGYSMNGLAKQSFYTIHVTPEPHCSYASFETNMPLTSYSKLVAAVLNIFKPGTVTITFFTEKASYGESVAVAANNPFDLDIEGYSLKHKTISELEGNCEALMLNYVSNDYDSCQPKIPKKVKFPVSATQPIYA